MKLPKRLENDPSRKPRVIIYRCVFEIEECDVMERWKEFFQDLLEEGYEGQESRELDKENNNLKKEAMDVMIEEEEAIQKMKMSQTSDHDKMKTKMIKFLKEDWKRELLNIFNQAK